MPAYISRANVASATALTLPEGANYIVVTGTTTITSISSRPTGDIITLRFSGALTFTYDATNLILQGSVNLTTAAGDVISLVSEGSGQWREMARRLAAAASAGAVTRAGGNTTEATTTSTTAVDLLSVASLSLGVSLPIQVLVGGRKTSGAASSVYLGLKLNATITADAGSAVFSVITFNTTNEAQSRSATFWLPQRVTLYGDIGSVLGVATGSANNAVAQGSAPAGIAGMPLDTITDVIIRGLSATSITTGADELHVYSLTAS